MRVHIKFLAHGSGSTVKAVQYLLGERDHQGQERDHVQVLRGDPLQVAAVGDNLSFALRYRSAVIAWGPDAPTGEQINAVIDDFERVSFAGLKDDGYSWTVVQHGKAGEPGVHVHALIARTELHTGLSFNPAPPGWQRAYDTVRDAHNHENGWARPDDPERWRLVQPAPHTHYQRASANALGQADPVDVRETITKLMVEEVENGTITSRDQVVAMLREDLGFKVRETKSSISVRADENSRPVRLKGAMYERGWTSKAGGFDRESPARQGRDQVGAVQGTVSTSRSGTDREDQRGRSAPVAVDERADDDPARRARNQMDEVISRRAAHNQQRYQDRESSDGTPSAPDRDASQTPCVVPDHHRPDNRAATDRVGDLDASNDPILVPASNGADPTSDSGWIDLRDDQRKRVDHLQENRPTLQKTERELTSDRTREQADRLINRASRAHRAVSQASQRLERATSKLRRLSRTAIDFGTASRGVRTAIRHALRSATLKLPTPKHTPEPTQTLDNSWQHNMSNSQNPDQGQPRGRGR